MKRRKFLGILGSQAAMLSLGQIPLNFAEASAVPSLVGKKRVAILGGGVAGMSAAQELIERGFEVSVYEMKAIPGGKARSINAPGTGTMGRKDLPGEHGFRFFPGFYKHIPDLFSRIPLPGSHRKVFDNLVTATRVLIPREEGDDIEIVARFPATLDELVMSLQTVFKRETGLTNGDLLFFARKLKTFMSACDERRDAEYDFITWWDYVEADSRSDAYRKYVALALTRSLVALKPKMASTRTVAKIVIQLLLQWTDTKIPGDRLLNGPTSEVWLDPWLENLRKLGVNYHLNALVKAIHVKDGKISGATILQEGFTSEIEADLFIAAVPVEVMGRLLNDELIAADPGLAKIRDIRTDWMNGIQFFLSEDVPIVHGHAIYPNSPWALTSVSQKQFWSNYDLSQYGDGTVRGILSVDISDWDAPGILYGKAARNCSAEEIAEETWAQLKTHLNHPGAERLRDSTRVSWFLDPGILFIGPNQTDNLEPLLVNTTGSWRNRPEAVTKIQNLFLASDYVRTSTDLATMEAANEAARRAVNGILKATGSSAPACLIFPLREPMTFVPTRQMDKLLFKLGLPQPDKV